MKFVLEHITKTLEVKQSKFIAHLLPMDMYDETLRQLRLEHPKARHFVVASRYVNEFDQIVEHCSDDGEPKGTSGKPTLAVLSGNELINSAVIIVRYFGGTKLGTGGLVRAYSQACNEVIHECHCADYVKLYTYSFTVAYSDITLIEYRLEMLKIDIQMKEFDEGGALFTLKAQEQKWESFYQQSKRIIKMKHS